MKEICPLCLNNKINNIEAIKSKNLMALYRSRKKIDVKKYFFGTDTIDLLECVNCNLLYYSPVELGDGGFYDQLQKSKDYYIEDKEEYRIASSFISSQDKVLEIGGGVGNLTKYLKTENYTGLEFSQDAIACANKKGINMIGQSLESHSESNQEIYDIVCYFQVLEHISNPHEFINQSLKCLKKGGKLIFAVPSEDSYCGTVVNDYLNAPPHHATRWKDTTIESLAKIFDIKKIDIIHDQIHGVHESFYYRTLLFNKMRALLNKGHKKYDLTTLSFFLYGTSYVLSPLYKYFSKKEQNIMGHSVIGVFEK